MIDFEYLWFYLSTFSNEYRLHDILNEENSDLKSRTIWNKLNLYYKYYNAFAQNPYDVRQLHLNFDLN